MADEGQAPTGAAGDPGIGAQRGEPSAGLREALQQQGGGGGYEPITDAAPERGIFHIVGGYLDEETGELHNEVSLRALTGEEEDLLGNHAVHVVDRLHEILAACTLRIGTITDHGRIREALARLPLGSREHLLVCLRRTSHWESTKDTLAMEPTCPSRACQQRRPQVVNLAEMEIFEGTPNQRVFAVTLPACQQIVKWRMASLAQEKVMYAVGRQRSAEGLTFGLLVRLQEIDGKDMRLSQQDFLGGDGKMIKLSKRAESVWDWARKLSTADRDSLRKSFVDHEPAINRTVDAECPACGTRFEIEIDVADLGFFFPSATSRRWSGTSST